MAFYQRIKDLREDADKTQTDVAAYLGTTAQYYGKYEKGERELPFSRAIQLAEYYDVSLDYLAERTNFPKGKNAALVQDDMLSILEKYVVLTERNKGKLEQFLTDLYEQQREDTAQRKEA
ncbi:MAG: helix-turn-helix transcriptional regulator [Oscillospiraceae bacterium]|nr:helix-turn-helix transcriptional regulator [Oscillospiraceae bacterium]